MELIKQTLADNETLWVERAANLFLINAATAALTVDVYKNNTSIFHAEGVSRGVKIRPSEGFEKVAVTNKSGAPNTIEIFVVEGDIDIQIQTGITVTVDNTLTNPIPVSVTSPVVLTASDVTVTQKASTVAGTTYTVAAAVTNISTAANVNRRAIHFRNTDATIDCYLAAFAAANKAACPILLRAGEVLMVDDRTCAAQWVAFSDGANITVAVQEVTE